MGSRFPFTSFPSGWFRLASSRELRPSEVKPLRYFSRDLVLFRTEQGSAHVLDAHCPHLGAHLGGGRVCGETIECPFHRWALNGEGQCVAVPYASRVPRAEIRSWPVREVNGQIMIYYGPMDEQPGWEFPEFPEFSSPEWTPFRRANHWKIRTHVQEFGENGMDLAHSPILHHQQTLRIRTESVQAIGPTFVHRTYQIYRTFRLARRLIPEVAGPLEISCYGLGCVMNRATVHAKIRLDYAYSFFFTPIDHELVEVSSLLSTRRFGGPLITYLLARKAIAEGKSTIEQDIPIWEHKCYRERPILRDGDGPILQYRRWARQFY